MKDEIVERLQIRDLIENWAIWRDAGDWERFATVWHDDGVMMATWFQGCAKEFIRVTQEGWAKGSCSRDSTAPILRRRGASLVEGRSRINSRSRSLSPLRKRPMP